MFPWFWMWAPQVHFPLSGDVSQDIAPETDWFFGAIPAAAGDGRMEQRIFEDTSYGRQLGMLSELVIALAGDRALPPRAAQALDNLQALRVRIEAMKHEEADALAAEVEQGLTRLAKLDPATFARIAQRMAATPALPDHSVR